MVSPRTVWPRESTKSGLAESTTSRSLSSLTMELRYKGFLPPIFNTRWERWRVPAWKMPWSPTRKGLTAPCLSKTAKVSPSFRTRFCFSAREELTRM